MAHYDFHNMGTAVSSVADSNQKDFNWFSEVVVNYCTDPERPNWQDYFLDNLQNNLAMNLRSAIRWTYLSQLGSLLGYRYNISNLYDGSKLSVETPILEYLHSIHPNVDSLSIQSWDITVNSYAWALKCYLYKHYNSLYSAYSFTDTFNKDTGVITVTFNDTDSTVVTINTNRLVLAQQYYINYVRKQKNWWEQYKDNSIEYEELYIYYDSVVSYQLDVFRFDYIKDTDTANLEPTSSTCVYVTYSYTEIQNQENEDGELEEIVVTKYGAIAYPSNRSIPLLDQAIINDARINASMRVVPSPCLPIRRIGEYVDTNSQLYKLCNKYIKKLTGNSNLYTKLYDTCKTQNATVERDAIRNQYIITGVSLSHPNKSAKRYWFTFANFLYEKWRDSRGYTDADIYDHWDGNNNYLYRLRGYITWCDGDNVMSRGMGWLGIWKHTVEGVAFSGAKKGDYYISAATGTGTPDPTPRAHSIYTSNGTGAPTETIYYTALQSRVPGVSFRHQDSTNSYTEIIMYGLLMFNPVGYWGAGDPNIYLSVYSELGNQIALREPTYNGYDSKDIAYYKEEIKEDENGNETLIKTPVYYATYDPTGSALSKVFMDSFYPGSVYIGIANLYQNMVCNVQTGHKFEIKGDTSDDDSGFIVPFDLVNMNKMNLLKLNDLAKSNLYVVSEYYRFDRVHYKSWKKWAGPILGIICIIIACVIVYCTWGGGSGAASPLAAYGATLLGGLGVLAVIFIKVVIAVVIMIVVKLIAKAIFGDSFLGMVFQTVATVIAMYYCGCFDGGNTFGMVAASTAIAFNNYAEYEKDKVKKLEVEMKSIQQKEIVSSQQYKAQMDLIAQKLLAISNPNSNFNVQVFINGLLLNTSKPCIDGLSSIADWNESLLSWTSMFHDSFISDQLDLNQYLQVEV